MVHYGWKTSSRILNLRVIGTKTISGGFLFLELTLSFTCINMDKLKYNEYVLRVGSYDSCELYPYFLLQEYADLKAELERTKAQLQTQQT